MQATPLLSPQQCRAPMLGLHLPQDTVCCYGTGVVNGTSLNYLATTGLTGTTGAARSFDRRDSPVGSCHVCVSQ